MTADTVGGVFTYAVQLAAALGRDGVDVTLATFGRPMSADQRRAVREAGANVILESGLALEWMADPWADVEAAEDLLLDAERAVRPHVVHLNSFVHGAAPWRAPVLVVGHSCVCSWWAAVHGEAPPPQWAHYRTAVAAGIAAAGAVTAPTQAMLSALDEWYGPLPPGSRPILNGVDGPVAVSQRKRAVVLSAGRLWDDGKNVAALARAAARPGLRGRVLLAGEGEVPGAAVALGPLAPDALARVRRGAAVYAAPALYEPFGLGILEAARDRCALVLGDIPSLRELWSGAAAFVPPDDEEHLAVALERLLADREATWALGEMAQRRARGYTAAAMSAAYRGMYRSLISAAERVAV